MLNVLRQELRAGWKGSAVWALSLAALTYLMMWLFPSIARQHAKWDQLVGQLPRSVLAGFGMNTLRLSDIYGYYGTQIYILLVLFVAIYAALLFAGILAREESDGTIDFLIARPITRGAIFAGKTVAALGLALGCNVVLFLATWASFAEFHTRPFALAPLVWLSVGLLLMSLVFGFFGLLVSIYLPRPRTLTSVTIGVALASYLVGIASAMSTKLTDLRFASPYQFVDAATVVRRSGIPPLHLGGLLLVCAVLAAWAFAFYRVKDIAA